MDKRIRQIAIIALIEDIHNGILEPLDLSIDEEDNIFNELMKSFGLGYTRDDIFLSGNENVIKKIMRD